MLQERGRRSCAPPPDYTALTNIRRGLEALISDAEITAAERQAREARTLHLRRQLEAATGCGAAMLAALGLPQLVGSDFVPLEREAARSALDQAIATLDALDGDPDLEDGAGDEPTGDDELSLSWTAKVDQVHFGYDQDDHGVTALERHGLGFLRSGPENAEDGRDAEEDERETLLGWVFGPGPVANFHI